MPDRPPVLVLSAGKISSELVSLFGHLPSGLIPINGKPALFYLLEELFSKGFRKITLAVGYQKEAVTEYVTAKYKTKFELSFVDVDHTVPPGNSILSCLKHLDDDRLLVVLGDTIFSFESDFEQSFILTSKDFDYPERWCLCNGQNGILDQLLDKPPSLPTRNGYAALIGVYYFESLKKIREFHPSQDRVEISSILRHHQAHYPIKIHETDSWHDVGHIDQYYQSKKSLLNVRFFNELSYDDLCGTITKRSKNWEKLQDEIDWYLNLPKNLSVLAPRIVDYEKGQGPEKTSITLEYYGYPTLSELFVYGDHSLRLWRSFISRLLKILNLFIVDKHPISESDYERMYLKKTLDRFELLRSNSPKIAELLDQPLTINGVTHQSVIQLFSLAEPLIHKLYSPDHNAFIHGDFCLPNILMDPNNGIIRVIDPRGRWNSSGPHGDIKYDLGKLRHSFVGGYDFLINDLFEMNQQGNNITWRVFAEANHRSIGQVFDELVSKNFDIAQIKLVEGLLFLSMLPLHSDHPDRQKGMLCNAIERLSEVTQSLA